MATQQYFSFAWLCQGHVPLFYCILLQKLDESNVHSTRGYTNLLNFKICNVIAASIRRIPDDQKELLIKSFMILWKVNNIAVWLGVGWGKLGILKINSRSPSYSRPNRESPLKICTCIFITSSFLSSVRQHNYFNWLPVFYTTDHQNERIFWI